MNKYFPCSNRKSKAPEHVKGISYKHKTKQTPESGYCSDENFANDCERSSEDLETTSTSRRKDAVRSRKKNLHFSELEMLLLFRDKVKLKCKKKDLKQRRQREETNVTKVKEAQRNFDHQSHLTNAKKRPEATVVSLQNKQLNDKRIQNICQSISVKRDMVKLFDISNNRGLGEISARAIADMIKQTDVREIRVINTGLDVWHNTIIQPALMENSSENGTRIIYRTKEVQFTLDTNELAFALGANGRSSISFPKNSVAEPTPITIELITPERKDFKYGMIPVTSIMRRLPSGTTLQAPVTIQLETWIRPKPTENSRKLKLQVFSRENEEAEWVPKQTIQHGNFNSVVFQTNHFSDEVVVVSDPIEANRAVYTYHNMLFVPEVDPTHDEDQVLVSWFVPNNEQARNETTLHAQQDGLKLYGGGRNNVTFALGQTLKMSLTQAEDRNREEIEIRPRIHLTSARAIAENIRRASRFNIELLNRQQHNAEEIRRAHLTFKVEIINQNEALVDDPVSVRWRPRGQQQQRPVNNFYLTNSQVGEIQAQSSQVLLQESSVGRVSTSSQDEDL